MPDARIDTGAEASTAQTPEDRGGGLMLSRARRWCVIAINARISDVSARLAGGAAGYVGSARASRSCSACSAQPPR